MLSNLSNWDTAQAEPVRIAVIGGVVALWGSLFAGAVSIMVAWAQGRIARRAVEAQERTIYLALIERRAAWLDYAITTWSAWIDHQEHRIEEVVTNQPLPCSGRQSLLGRSMVAGYWQTNVIDMTSLI